MEEWRSGEGGKAESKGWSGWSGDALDAETEEGGLVHATLTASLWVTQERWARGLRVDARAGRSDSPKVSFATAAEASLLGNHGAWEKRAENGVRQNQ